ncbi:hypothetical protein [Streptomyces klenkii]|uniref:hypothetical protein n=1 Tax=Streptomyces klenkii TaxID=1420899 RepID=UPI00343B0B68
MTSLRTITTAVATALARLLITPGPADAVVGELGCEYIGKDGKQHYSRPVPAQARRRRA